MISHQPITFLNIKLKYSSFSSFNYLDYTNKNITGDIMNHEIDLKNYSIRTDLIDEIDEVKNNKKLAKTEEKIDEYEDDLKNGVDVTKKDYVVVKDSYDNSYTRLSLKLSKKIENGINKVIKYLFNKIGQTVNENN